MPVDGESLIRRLALLLIYQCMSVPTLGTTILSGHHYLLQFIFNILICEHFVMLERICDVQGDVERCLPICGRQRWHLPLRSACSAWCEAALCLHTHIIQPQSHVTSICHTRCQVRDDLFPLTSETHGLKFLGNETGSQFCNGVTFLRMVRAKDFTR